MNIEQMAKRHNIDPDDLLTCIVDNGFYEYVRIGSGIYDTVIAGHLVPTVDKQIDVWLAERVIKMLTQDQPAEEENGDEDEEPV